MLLRQLKSYLAVVEAGSFTEAAARRFVSQSAISQQIQALERELGVELLRRENRKFTLTEAGEFFYQRGRILADEVDRLCRETAGIGRKGEPHLRVGYLRGYSGLEFQMAVAAFAQRYPEAAAEILEGNHEDLYAALRDGSVDMALNDQRRAFSDAYVNRILTTSACYIELAEGSPLARRESLTAGDLRAMPCILVASPGQRENERTYYQEVVGLDGDFLFAETLERARLLAAGGKGYLPVEGVPETRKAPAPFRRVPLLRGGKPVMRNYCVFWRSENQNPYVEAFAGILQEQFSPSDAGQ